MKYLIKKEQRIAYCILNNIKDYHSTTAQEMARNISDYFLYFLITRNYDIFINDSTDALLSEVAKDDFYTHAVVVATGTHTELTNRLFDAVEEKCKEDFTLAGHILDRNDSYYEIHNQFFIMNMKEFKRLGMPAMGDVEWNSPHYKIEPLRSVESVKDNDLPIWIKQGWKERQYKEKRHGWNFINIGLENNAVFCDLGTKIRNHKFYLYCEYDHIFYRQVPQLHGFILTCNNMVTPWNSDSLPTHIKINDTLDHYITTGTGLNWIQNLINLGYNSSTKVTFTDINYAVLDFMQSLIEEWDGTDYASFYMSKLKRIPNNYKDYDLVNHENKIRNWFIDFKNNFPNFKQHWTEIKRLKFNYILIDYYADNNYDFINTDENTFMNISNIFNYVPFAPFSTVKFRVARENNLIKSLQNLNPNIWLYTTARLGHIYKKELASNEKITFGRVKDFSLWNINEFNAPPWQEENWKSYCREGNLRILE